MFDWSTRLKNPVFLTSFAASLVAFGYTLLGLFEVVPTVSESDVMQLVTTAITALTAVGVLVNPTTSGVTD